MRLRSDIWVSAYRRRCELGGAYAMIRRRGAAEAGAILIKIDRLDGKAALFGPAPQSLFDEGDTERRFVRMHDPEVLDVLATEERLAKEVRFDPDLWIVEIEDKQGRHFLLDEESGDPNRV